MFPIDNENHDVAQTGTGRQVIRPEGGLRFGL
jgi:hypothetical protein